jgi:hypothetical protein
MIRGNAALAATGPAALAAVALLLGACRGQPAVRFENAVRLSGATTVGTAPTFAVSPRGTEAAAWVSAPGGGTDGRLYVSVGRAAPVELRDPLGPIEVHGESPPKLTYGPDGTLHAIYVVPRLVPGKRFAEAALRYVHSTDGGRSWSEPVAVTDNATFGTHNFHALHAAADGSIYVAWLDNRDGKSAAYLTRSADGGKTWEPNRPVTSGEACPCCRTAIATAGDGTLYVAWRLVAAGNVRDVVVSRSSDHGYLWSAPARVHADDWVFPGCPHAGPSMQVDAENRLHVAWWTGREGAAGVYYARSDDGARTFTDPVPLGTAEFSRPAHVQLALGAGGQIVVAWDDGTRQTPRVVLRVSRDGGQHFSHVQEVSQPGRAATFPVLGVARSAVTVAWSDESEAADLAARRADSLHHATNPQTSMGLTAVGEAQVIARRGVIR